MNFYRSALDGMVRHPDDQPSVGIILCKSKSGLVAEYSLMDMSKPIGVSEYRLTSRLPDGLSGQLPKSAGIEGVLEEAEGEMDDEKGLGRDGVVCEVWGGESLETVGIYTYVSNKAIMDRKPPLDVVCLGKKRCKRRAEGKSWRWGDSFRGCVCAILRICLNYMNFLLQKKGKKNVQTRSTD
jgi:hypothetical protein